jgi:hypothetical protein
MLQDLVRNGLQRALQAVDAIPQGVNIVIFFGRHARLHIAIHMRN